MGQLQLTEDFSLPSPCVMGILNVTPDSFSDGGQYRILDRAVQHALEMQAEGAAIIDIGGESTRPGAAAVSEQEELDRVLPVIEKLRQQSAVPISVDTSNPQLMREAVALGANLINDVRALQKPGALAAAAELGVPVCLMHMQGQPRGMQADPSYPQGVVQEIHLFLRQRRDAALAAGIAPGAIILDPGFGFGKTLAHNLQLLKQLDQFLTLDCPVLVGLSRKSMFGNLLGRPVDQRLAASLAAAVLAVTRGAAMVRAHDIKPTVDALTITSTVMSYEQQ